MAWSQDLAAPGSLPAGAEALRLDRLLPMAKVSPFHCFFINFCIEKDLPALLLRHAERKLHGVFLFAQALLAAL